jgi:hypothetical protein
LGFFKKAKERGLMMKNAKNQVASSWLDQAKDSLKKDLRQTGRMFRFCLIFSALTAAFWALWHFVAGYVPVITRIPVENGYWYPPFDVSCWWSVLYIGLMASFFVLLFSKEKMKLSLSLLPTILLVLPLAAALAGFGFGLLAGWIDKPLMALGLIPGVKAAGAIATVTMIVCVVVFFVAKSISGVDSDDLGLQEWIGISLSALAGGTGILCGLSVAGAITGDLNQAGLFTIILMGACFACWIPSILMVALFLAICFVLGPVIALYVFALKAGISIFSWANKE